MTMQFRQPGLSELLERISLAIVSARTADLLLLHKRWNYIAFWATLQLPAGYPFDIVNVTVHFRSAISRA